MKVTMKFGGTSVGSVAALHKVVSIINKHRQAGHQLVVIVSAMSGVTDKLIKAAKQAEAGDEHIAHQVRQEIEAKHKETILAILQDEETQQALLSQIKAFLDEFVMLCHAIHILGELTPRALDVISGLGERMSVKQVAALLNAHDIPASPLDATELIVTDDRHGGATPLVEETALKTQNKLNPMLEAGVVPIITGFIGATEEGVQTTLGRGGSDYSATILGRAIEADEIWIWTDVNGVMTTDPRVVSNAKTIPHLSFVEVGELAHFGAKVLHPRAIRPARQANIPVRMLNTFEPDHPGTLIDNETDHNGHVVKAVTAIKNMSLMTIAGTGMVGIPGVAGRTFSAVADTDTSVLMISQASSEQSICFVVSSDDAPKVLTALRKELSRELERRDLDEVVTQDDVVILTVVGAGMHGTPGVAARLFGALANGKINVIAIAQGGSEYNISLVILEGDANTAVKLVHDEFLLYE